MSWSASSAPRHELPESSPSRRSRGARARDGPRRARRLGRDRESVRRHHRPRSRPRVQLDRRPRHRPAPDRGWRRGLHAVAARLAGVGTAACARAARARRRGVPHRQPPRPGGGGLRAAAALRARRPRRDAGPAASGRASADRALRGAARRLRSMAAPAVGVGAHLGGRRSILGRAGRRRRSPGARTRAPPRRAGTPMAGRAGVREMGGVAPAARRARRASSGSRSVLVPGRMRARPTGRACRGRGA